jgi:hypothetical protein
MNLDLESPKEFFIFCNRYRPITAHNLTFPKTFVSAAYSYCSSKEFSRKYEDGTATYLPFLPAENDCKIISPYLTTAMNNYRIEYDAEICRKMYYPKYPSRISAIFAFGDLDTCKKVYEKYPNNGWDLSTIKKFTLIDSPFTRVIKVNMEIVSLARYAYLISYSPENDLDTLWKHYWSGGGNIQMELPDVTVQRKKYESGEIFEYLIEGSVVLSE